MEGIAASLEQHRASAIDLDSVRVGVVRYAPIKSVWFLGMASGALVGGALTFTWSAFALFVFATAVVLLLGHSLGSHRKLVHDSYQCPKWMEYLFVYCGVQVGLAGPIGLLRQHELRDYAQRLPTCHDYLRHGRSPWVDAWWQLNCELVLRQPPAINIEDRIAQDRFYRFLERTWMAQHLPWALLLYAAGGWGFVCWGVCARVTAGVFGHWLIGYLAHNHGTIEREVRGAAVQGRNIRFVSLLTMGECWHNNHHAFPGSARLGLEPGEWDPGWWVLQGLHRFGLVWDIRLPMDLPARREVVTTSNAQCSTRRRSRPSAASAPSATKSSNPKAPPPPLPPGAALTDNVAELLNEPVGPVHVRRTVADAGELDFTTTGKLTPYVFPAQGCHNRARGLESGDS
jgi:fatty-acid desaturase